MDTLSNVTLGAESRGAHYHGREVLSVLLQGRYQPSNRDRTSSQIETVPVVKQRQYQQSNRDSSSSKTETKPTVKQNQR